MKNKKVLIGAVIIFIFLIITIIGFFNIKKNIKLSEKEDKNKYKEILESAPPEFKEVIKFLETPDKKIAKELYFANKLEKLKLQNKKIELEANLIELTARYINNIKIKNDKNLKEYANEVKNVLNKLKFIQIDFDNKESIKNSGELILSIAEDFSKIEVPKEYYDFHRAETFILSLMGLTLNNLASTNDSEQSFILMSILNNLSDLQEKLIEKL